MEYFKGLRIKRVRIRGLSYWKASGYVNRAGWWRKYESTTYANIADLWWYLEHRLRNKNVRVIGPRTN